MLNSKETKLFNKYLNRFKPIFSKPQFSNFAFCAKGILATDRRTISRLAEQNNYNKNQSALNRFLTESPWSDEILEKTKMKKYLNLIESFVSKDIFLLILDMFKNAKV